MKYQKDIYRRKSLRLKGYNYKQAGAYFVSICTLNRACLFGNIISEEMVLNDAGRIVADEWIKTVEIRNNIELDEWVVMPNHFHGILVINECRGTARRAPTVEEFGKPVPGSIPTIIRSFKSAVTKRINELRNSPGEKVWQRNYYEHIIRNENRPQSQLDSERQNAKSLINKNKSTSTKKTVDEFYFIYGFNFSKCNES
jgi:putative transposase